MDTNLSIEEIETAISGYPDSPFYVRTNIVIPNVSWGFLNHEADLLSMSKAKYLTEIEIKRSFSDFMADFRKNHNHYDPKLHEFYYAVPIKIAEKVFNYLYEGEFVCSEGLFRYDYSKITGYSEHNPNKCGLIIYASAEELGKCYKRPKAVINVPASIIGKYKISIEEELKLLRLLGLRIWNLKKKLSKQIRNGK